jgi:hypothetical protein
MDYGKDKGKGEGVKGAGKEGGMDTRKGVEEER